MKKVILLFLLCGASCARQEATQPVATRKPESKVAVAAASVVTPAALQPSSDPEYVRARDLLHSYDGDLSVVQQARDIAMKMLATNTAYAPAYVILARCELDEAYESGYDWDLAGTTRALKFADHALQLDPNNVDAMVVTGRAWLAQHDFDAATRFFDQADAARPGDQALKEARVSILIQTGKLKEAVALAKEVIASPGADADTKWSAYSDIADVDEALGYKDGADAANRAAIALNPSSAWGHGNYAHFLLRRGDVDGAIAEAQRAVKLKPYPLAVEALARGYIEKASALYDAQQYRESGDYLQKALALAGKNARTNLAAGMFYQRAYARSKDAELRDRAVAAFRKTLELDPANSVAQKALDELTRN